MHSVFKVLFKSYIAISLIVAALVAFPALGKPLHPKTIVVLGDSLSAAYGMPADAGWVNLLQQRITKQQIGYQVINASISGETTSGGLSRFEGMLNEHKPDIVILELGGNDGLRGLNVQETYQNLKSMIKQAQRSHTQVLLLGMKIPPNYGFKYSQQFSEIYQKLAHEFQLIFVPFFLEGVAGNPKWIQADGLHPNAEAQPMLLDIIWPALENMINV